LLLWSALLLGGCAAGHTFVLDRPAGMPRFQAVAIHEGHSTAELDPALRAHFESVLRKRLQPAFARESESVPPLDLEYRVISHDKGSAAARVVNGAIQVVGVPVSGLGDGTLGVEVLYRDPSGATLAHIVADGPIAGVLGSSSSGLDSAAASIAAFTTKTFGSRDSDAVAIH
jgi:hypothetical protein